MWKGLALLAANEMGGAVRRRAMAIGFYVFASIIALIAGVFGLNALHTWLSYQYTDILASLMIAGGLLVLALILAVIGLYQKHRSTATDGTSAALMAAPIAATLIGRKLSAGSVAVIATLVAGAVLGRRIGKV